MTPQRAESVRVAYPLFQAEGGGSTPTSALQLHVGRIGFDDAKALNRLWHSRLPNYGRGCVPWMPDVCFAAEFDGLYYAVALWSNPVARNLPQQTWLELRRLAISGDAPRNTASRMLAVMARLIRQQRPEVVQLVSYHEIGVNTGGIYRAAGWKPTVQTKFTDWGKSSRGRKASVVRTDKQRWEKTIAGGAT